MKCDLCGSHIDEMSSDHPVELGSSNTEGTIYATACPDCMIAAGLKPPIRFLYGGAIRGRMFELGRMGMAELADKCGVGRFWLSEVIHGKGAPSKKLVHNLASALETTPGMIAYGDILQGSNAVTEEMHESMKEDMMDRRKERQESAAGGAPS